MILLLAANVVGKLVIDFSDYIVYVDESGDHDLLKINSKYPVFVLSFCIFHKKYYNEKIVPSVQDLKFRYFGHDMIVLHEREILKKTGTFANFSDKKQQAFLNDINALMDNTKFMMIACVVRKDKLVQKYIRPFNPYHIALQYGLERIYRLMCEKDQHQKKTFIIFEQRGDKEDEILKNEFLRVCQGANYYKTIFNFEMILAHKQVNSTGLQFADLTARPIGNHCLKPNQPNRAFDVIKSKLCSCGGREFAGSLYADFGLKIFP